MEDPDCPLFRVEKEKGQARGLTFFLFPRLEARAFLRPSVELGVAHVLGRDRLGYGTVARCRDGRGLGLQQ
jgi:hypothetical protein